MNREEETKWQRDLEQLRDRLNRLEQQNFESLDALRQELSLLQSRTATLAENEHLAPPEPLTAPLESPASMQPPPLPSPVIPPERPVTREPEKSPSERGTFEMQLGRVWLVRLGIILLLTGLVLLGNFAYQNWIREMPNGVRLAALFAIAGIIIETGRRLASKPALQRFGEVIIAGGLAFFYYCTFAAHHVARLQVIESPVVASILLLFSAAFIAAVSWFRNTQTTATLGLLLASYSTMLQPIGWLSCVSSTLLAGAGLFLMRRPGWAAPGIAALLGTYSAFFGWQFLGAAQSDLQDRAILWFLPPVWAMFSLPGLLIRFRETMSGRARAWFTGGNNAAFFLLFSGLWLSRFQDENYWVVCAVIGVLLICPGVIGRRHHQIAGGVNLSQGIGLLSLAMILKLDGYHLALGLAGESLILAAAFAKFRGRSEMIFSCVAALGATGMLLIPQGSDFSIPLWSAGLASLLLGASSVVLCRGESMLTESWSPHARIGTAAVFFLSLSAAIWGWSLRLPAQWPLPVLAGIATALTIGTTVLDRSRKMPELALGSLLTLVMAFQVGLFTSSPWMIGSAGALAFAACWLWHRQEISAETTFDNHKNLFNFSTVAGWAFSIATVLATWAALQNFEMPVTSLAPLVSASAMGLISLALLTRCRRAAVSAAFLHPVALLQLITQSETFALSALIIAGIAMGCLAMIARQVAGTRLVGRDRATIAIATRATAFFAVCYFWRDYSPEFFGDGIAFSTALLMAIFLLRKQRFPIEIWGFLTLAALWLVFESALTSWSISNEPSWRGVAVVLALLIFSGSSRSQIEHTMRAHTSTVTTALTCAILSLWATQMLVWRHDWTAVAVLWTLLGFAKVSAGLWLRMRVMRLIGFALLTLAIIKIFAIDVWDFSAFMRVISFMVLGGVLILLGLFYNKFSVVLKNLMNEDPNAARG